MQDEQLRNSSEKVSIPLPELPQAVRAVSSPEELITEEQLRQALNLPNIYAVRELRQKRKIPFVRMGYRTLRYSLPRVLKALEKLEVKEAGAVR